MEISRRRILLLRITKKEADEESASNNIGGHIITFIMGDGQFEKYHLSFASSTAKEKPAVRTRPEDREMLRSKSLERT